MADTAVKVRPRSSRHPIIIIGSLFFIFGFVTWLNSVLIPYLRIACQLNNFDSYLVAFAFYIAYFVMALPSGWVLKRSGFKKGMSLGLTVMAVGALIFIPAAITRTYGLFLTGLFVQGTGLALLQTASNPYITIIGPSESAAQRISIMGICNKLAGAIAPIILGAIVLKNADAVNKQPAELDALAARVIIPYIIIVAVLVLLSLFIYFSRLPEIDTEETTATANTNIFRYRNLMLGVLALFLYVGAEVLAGDTIISYAAWQGISFSTAKFFTSCTLSAMIVGYIIGIICIPKYISQQRALQWCAVSGIIFSLCALLTQGFTSVLFIALLGLANSLVWPAIWPLALAGLGKFTKPGSALLIMSIAGGALLPLLYGRLADVFNAQKAYWILVPCYLFILYYAVYGQKNKILFKH